MPQPNVKLETLLDNLLPKAQETTITLSFAAFNKLVDKYFAMEAEINSKGEVRRVAEKTTPKEPQVAQGIPVEEPAYERTITTTKGEVTEKVEKATGKKGGK